MLDRNQKSCVNQFVGLSYENLSRKTDNKSVCWWAFAGIVLSAVQTG